jgi:hypothetical protein
MSLSRLNLICSILSAAGALVLILFSDPFGGLVWLAASFVWLVLAFRYRNAPPREPHAARRIGRRLARLLIWS